MKLRIASLTILCLALAALPAWGDIAPGYDNGPINGTTDAWTINLGYVVSNTFIGTNYIDLFQFGVWEFPGDTMSSVLWSISSVPNPPNARSILAFGTATQRGGSGGTLSDKFISTNQYGYNIDLISVFGLNVSLGSRNTYWLNLQNAAVPSGDPVYWDENSGVGCRSNGCPSKAFQSGVGTIPSEAFTINAGHNGNDPSGAPEPSSVTLLGWGILAVLGVLRGKLNF